MWFVAPRSRRPRAQPCGQAAQGPACPGCCPSREPDGPGAWKNTRAGASRAICTHAAFPGLIRAFQPGQPRWSPASATAKRRCCDTPDCPSLPAAVGYPGSAFCSGITPILLKESSAMPFFFYYFFLMDISPFLAVCPHAG